MHKEDCFRIGTIVKPHGVHGEIILDSNTPQVVENIKESVFLEIEGLLVPFFIDELKALSSQRSRIKFLWIETEQKARDMVGCAVYSLNEELGLEEEDFAQSPKLLVDFTVHDIHLGEIGVVKEFIENPSNPLLVVEHGKKELLLPIHPHFVVKIQPKLKSITLNLPEGLVDLF